MSALSKFEYSKSEYPKFKCPLKSQKGQGLIEYLIIVSLVAIATMGIMRVLGQSVSARFTNITYAIQGKPKPKEVQTEEVEESHYRKKDMSDFFYGAVSKDGK